MHVICCSWPFYCRLTRKYPLQWMRTLWMKNGTISSWQWLKGMFGFIWIVNLKERSMPPFSYHLIFFHLLSKIWISYINVNKIKKKSHLIDISTWFTLTNDLRKDSVLLHFQRFIGSQPLIDTDGVLLVGAKAPSTERFIGYLQDVRIYTARLQDR